MAMNSFLRRKGVFCEKKESCMEVAIRRLGHRQNRDKRITPHGELVRRALGANGMLLASEDKGLESNLTMYDENILSFAGFGNSQIINY